MHGVRDAKRAATISGFHIETPSRVPFQVGRLLGEALRRQPGLFSEAQLASLRIGSVGAGCVVFFPRL